ncbi:hypothetical protein NKG95_32120 [Mesorhizobium sp. M1423]|uniref:hypothetical protein n=1 Tax=Mesorhizobium sp. M1423 TaxID=2957101 RepID=UPI00333BCE48
MALDQLFHPTNDHSRFPSAERFAMGKELSEQILALNPPQGDDPKFWSYPAIARYHENGNEVRAIELVELAMTSLDGPEPVPDELETAPSTGFAAGLGQLQAENVCYGALCLVPQKQFPEGTKARSTEEKDKKG